MSKARDLADFISDSTIETAEIADGAVTAGKLNVTGNGTLGQALTSDADGSFSWTTITSDLVDDASPQLGADLDTNGNDITFGDNDKAIFGAGSDLQIYHDGATGESYITESGTANFFIQGTNLRLQDTLGANYLTAQSGGELYLYHNGLQRVQVNTSGIDVTGTVTADGLTVDTATDVAINCSNSFDGINITGSNVNGAGGRLQLLAPGASGTGRTLAILNDSRSSVDEIKFQANTDFAFSDFDTGDNRFRIADNGDISFYEDTGTTPKLFWDASTENLGLGTTSPVASNSNHRAIQIHHPDIYQAQLRLTNSTSGAGANDGFNIQFDGTDVYLVNQESTGDIIAYTNSNERMRINSSGNVGIGTSNPTNSTLHAKNSSSGSALKVESNTGNNYINFYDGATRTALVGTADGSTNDFYVSNEANTPMLFRTNGTERMRLDATGDILVGRTSLGVTVTGIKLAQNGVGYYTTANDYCLYLNRQSSDGDLQYFAQANTVEGSISVSGSSVSYNGGHLARWSRLADDSKDTSIVRGTVMTNLDEMVVWSHDAIEAQDAVYDEEGNLVSEVIEAKEAYTENNEQLNKMAVSSVEGDPNVSGVFVRWDESDGFNDFTVAMTGDMVIRIASGTTVARGDLLMSAGDGTAKPQDDDIVRSKTIAKVTSTHVSHTYDDGSYLVPCVLMAC